MKLAPTISDAHFEKMMALKPANARKHTYAGQLLMEAIDREYAARVDNVANAAIKSGLVDIRRSGGSGPAGV